MQGSLYNNPMFAQSLAGLVGQFIGDPNAAAQRELYASEALLNNQTAQYRDAIGDTGLQGDLASMMIRALQAGPDYSDNAPTIGAAAMGFEQAGQGGLGQMVQAAMPAPGVPAPGAPRGQPILPPTQPAPDAPLSATPALLPPGPPFREAAGMPMQPGPNEMAIVLQARERLAQGAEYGAVARRLQELGIDPALLRI
jgi:hypothetical protein